MMNYSDIQSKDPNELVPLFLMASYAYYHRGDPFMSDYAFDIMALTMREQWDSIEHPYKHLITEGNLATCSGFDIKIPDDLKEKTLEILRAEKKE